MAHTEKDDNHPMEETEDSARKGAFKGFHEKRKVNEPCRQKHSRRSQSWRGENKKGRVTESDRKRGKILAQNFQEVGILLLQKAPRHLNGEHS